jgi:hypothetical protein
MSSNDKIPGEQEFRSGSFRGGTFVDADFSGVDVRGADFTGADLRSASFRDARLGVPPSAGVTVLGLALLVAIGAGVVIGWSVHGTLDRLSADAWDEIAAGGTLAFTLALFVALIIWRGLDVALRVVAVVYVGAVAINIVANVIWEQVEWRAAFWATLLIVFMVLAVGAGLFARLIGGLFGMWAIAVVAMLGGLASGRADGGIAGIVVAVCLVVISKRALRGDSRDRTLRRVAHRLVRRWGTRFVDANLTGADFTGVDMSRCDVTGATLDGVQWEPLQVLYVDIEHDRP